MILRLITVSFCSKLRYWSIKAKPGKTQELAAAIKAVVTRANEINDSNLRAFREVVGTGAQFHLSVEVADANTALANTENAMADEEFRRLFAVGADLIESSHNALLEEL